MKPFDLEKALAGEPVVTGAGEPVTDLHYFSTAVSKYKVYATVEGRVHSYTETGSYNPDIALGCSYDLFMAAKKRVWLVNIYKDRSCSSVYESEDDAKRERVSAVVATVKVEWEDETF